MASQELLNNPSEAAVYTTANGVPYPHHPYAAQRAGPDGPLLLQDTHMVDLLAHFDRERVPERVVHAKGAGAHGYFELTESLSDITCAAPLQSPGYKCPITMRFSTVGGESGSPDTARDPRGFSIKMRTEQGNMDWVFNNTPVFFLRDPVKFPHFIHTQKRDPQTHLNQNTDATHTWNYYVQNLECIHQVVYQFGDRGTPKSFRHMNGYSGHTFCMLTAEGKLTYVQIHAKADGGVQNLTWPEAVEMMGKAPDLTTQDLFTAIESGEKPSWSLYVQTMTPEQARSFRYSIFDLTKVWPHKEFPLRKFGRFVLDKNPENYFAEIEQIAFSPGNLVPGIEPSRDPVLQSRLFSYPDTHRHRLGPNYQQLPINRARPFTAGSGCPFLAGNFERDGLMTFESQGNRPNYISTIRPMRYVAQQGKALKIKEVDTRHTGTISAAEEAQSAQQQKMAAAKRQEDSIWEATSFLYLSGVGELDLEQPRALYQKVFDAGQKKRFVENVVAQASSVKQPGLKEIIAQMFGLLDGDLGKKIADGLGVKYEQIGLEEYIKRAAKGHRNDGSVYSI